jgi:sec-independent protein translocase protein TatB
MFGMGMPEIIMILAIALIVIGPRKLPDLGRSLGRAMREFRKATSEFKSSLNIDDDLGDVRRSFTEMNADLKSTLSAAAFDDKAGSAQDATRSPDGKASPPPDPDAASAPDPAAEPATGDAPGATTPDPATRPGQERGDAGS